MQKKVYGGVADAGLGLFSTIVAGLGGVAGFVAEQVPFQSESSEDRLSRDLLGGIEFGGAIFSSIFRVFHLGFQRLQG